MFKRSQAWHHYSWNHLLRLLVFLSTFSLTSSMGLFSQTTVYVNPSAGNDDSAGTITKPFKTIGKGVASIPRGGIVYLRGGTYTLSGATRLKLDSVGTSGSRFRLWAYPGETPILDFLTQSNNSDIFKGGIELSGDYWHLKGIEEKNCVYNNGCILTGSNNILEQCVFHDNGDSTSGSGLYVFGLGSGKTANNLIYNCDSYGNYDTPTNGNNADGFDICQDLGTGNVVRGCRAWHNSDDGFDCWNSTSSVLFDSCYAFGNGFGDGDGNGFKMGGNSTNTQSAAHIYRNCLSANNKTHGFDQNGNLAGQTVYNCTAYHNGGANFNLTVHPTKGQNLATNCIDYMGGGGSNIYPPKTETTNSWNGFTLTNGDFVIVDSTGEAGRARNSDGSLPASNFLRLANGSSLINAGTNVGLPYTGSAPNLGAFETVEVTVKKDANAKLVLSIKLLDFGEVPANQSRLLPVLITNSGTDTLIVARIVSPDSIFSASKTSFSLAPGASLTDSICAHAPREITTVYGAVIIVSNSSTRSDTISAKLKTVGSAVGVESNAVPTRTSLFQNYPNPFNPSTMISFELEEASAVTLEVFNVLGSKVCTLLSTQIMNATLHSLTWNGRDASGALVSSGIYLYRIRTDRFSASKKMMFLH